MAYEIFKGKMMGLCQEFRQLRGSLLLLAWMTLPGLPPAQAASADTIPSLPSVRIENTARTEQKEVDRKSVV